METDDHKLIGWGMEKQQIDTSSDGGKQKVCVGMLIFSITYYNNNFTCNACLMKITFNNILKLS